MDANTVIAISATVIAVASLAVSIYQVRATRQHNRHMLRPLLQLRSVFVPGQTAGLKVVNSGLGPAIVTGTRVWLDGQALGPWNKETSRQVRENMDPRPRAATLFDGMGVPSGHFHFLLGVDAYSTTEHGEFRRLVEQRVDVEIRYDSLYGGEGFVVSTRLPDWRSATALPFGAPVPKQGAAAEDDSPGRDGAAR
jgi:hypothetical protein